MDLAAFGDRLRKARLDKGLTQRQLAEPDYTHAYVSTIEAGKRQPSDAAIEYFAEKLGMAAIELRTGQPASLPGRLELELMEARLALAHGGQAEAREAYRKIEKTAKRFGLARIQSKAVLGQATCFEQAGDPESAVRLFEEAEKIGAGGSTVLRVDARVGRSRCLLNLGETSAAIYVLEAFLEMLEQEGLRDPVALMKTYATLVLPYIEFGLQDRAENAAAEALRLMPMVQDPQAIAIMEVNVARAYLFKDQFEECDAALIRAEDLFTQLDFETEVAIARLARGYSLISAGKLQEATDVLRAAEQIFKKNDATLDEGRVLNELGRIARLEGRDDDALNLLERARSVLAPHGTSELAITERELGELIGETDAAEAIGHFHRAIDLFRRAEQRLEIARTYRLLGDLHESKGRADEASAAYRLGILAVEPAL
ncbi:MAG TPA: tetratricopeptide repeat protein [Actinomycetota bacterium]|nr:tetratricopeptide repeat protein [Actinomycetota bacterium]